MGAPPASCGRLKFIWLTLYKCPARWPLAYPKRGKAQIKAKWALALRAFMTEIQLAGRVVVGGALGGLALHLGDGLRHLLDGRALFAIQIGLRHRQPQGHFAHAPILQKFHLEDVVQNPIRGELALALGFDALDGLL